MACYHPSKNSTLRTLQEKTGKQLSLSQREIRVEKSLVVMAGLRITDFLKQLGSQKLQHLTCIVAVNPSELSEQQKKYMNCLGSSEKGQPELQNP